MSHLPASPSAVPKPLASSSGVAVPPLPPPSEHMRHWSLDPGTVYLNHGSFGATPNVVLQEQQQFRQLMEADPVRFMVELLPGLMHTARVALATFVNSPAADLVFVPNATTAIATVLENLASSWNAGDEILATSHEYPACMNNLRRLAARRGANIITVEIPFPLENPSELTAAVMAKVTGRTRAALISQVTSPSALMLPVAQIVAQLEGRGIRTIVDGAHAVGFAPVLDLQKLAPSFYTANCHKWLCTPKGSAFLYVREDLQPSFRPLVLSNNAEKPIPGRKQLLTEFDYVGTDDPTAYLAIPRAIEFLGGLLPGGWPQLMAQNRELVLRGRRLLCEQLQTEPPAPDSMLGPMATIWLPPHHPDLQVRLAARPSRYHDALQDVLLEKHRIQVPIWAVPGQSRRFIRISAQAYNSDAQYEYLAQALLQEIEAERRL